MAAKKAQWSGMGRCGQANMAYTDAEDKETIKSWLDWRSLGNGENVS